jgi:hypothetical protein
MKAKLWIVYENIGKISRYFKTFQSKQLKKDALAQ